MTTVKMKNLQRNTLCFVDTRYVLQNLCLPWNVVQAHPQIEREHMIFKQDTVPPHYTNVVCEFMSESFPRRWIGRGG